MNGILTSRWYVAQTCRRAEATAAGHLNRQGFPTFIPRFLKRTWHARRVKMVAAPLFPHYLFVSVDIERQRWRSIQSTFGVSRLVCNGDSPAVVDNAIIENIRQRENELGFIQLDQRPCFKPGEKVRVLDGAFTDSFGLYESMTEHERVTILLDLLGQKVTVILDANLVAAA
jgi:transcriptional antiterminator RfaH